MDGDGNNADGQQQQQQQQQQAPQRPEYIPEKYWNAEKGEARIEDLGKGYTELATKFGKGKEAYDAERLAKRPAKADEYKVAVPKEGPLAERISKSNIVLFDKAPGADFKPEAGKQYLVLDDKNPMLGWWRERAHSAGLSNDDFMDGVWQFAEMEAGRQTKSSESVRTEIAEEMKKLGDHGSERAKFAYDRLGVLLGDKAKAFDFIKVDAAGTEAMEALLEKLGEPKFSPGSVENNGGVDTEALRKEAKELQNATDYYQDDKKQARVAEIFKKLHPGTRETAATGPTHGR